MNVSQTIFNSKKTTVTIEPDQLEKILKKIVFPQGNQEDVQFEIVCRCDDLLRIELTIDENSSTSFEKTLDI